MVVGNWVVVVVVAMRMLRIDVGRAVWEVAPPVRMDVLRPVTTSKPMETANQCNIHSV